MNRLYSRFKFLDIRQGKILGKYFEVYGRKFDPETEFRDLEIQTSTKKYRGPYTSYLTALSIFEFKLFDTFVYLGSWLLKLIAALKLIEAKYTQEITKSTCYFIHLSQKLHLIAFNLVALEIIIYCNRTIFHLQG